MSVQAIARVMASSEAQGIARLVLLAMANRAGGDDDICFASVERIAYECRVNPRTVQRNIASLVEAGDLGYEGVHPELRTNVYRVMGRVAESHPPGASTPPAPPNREKVLRVRSSVVPQASSLPQVPSSTDRSERRKAKPDVLFDAEFWPVYPRKVEKAAARRRFAALVRSGIDPQAIIAGAARYAEEQAGVDPQYVKHPTAWLNKGCWEDEPVSPSTNGNKLMAGISAAWSKARAEAGR